MPRDHAIAVLCVCACASHCALTEVLAGPGYPVSSTWNLGGLNSGSFKNQRRARSRCIDRQDHFTRSVFELGCMTVQEKTLEINLL